MRRRREEEHENHERWLVSYADFITLLFAFFVVMYSISSINEGKYRVLSDALVAAFRSPSKSLQPIEIGKLAKSAVSSPIELPYEFRKKSLHRERQLRPVEAPPALGVIGDRRGTGSTAVKVIASEIRQAVKELIDKNLITIHQGKTWLEIEIKASILFPSGSAAINDKALPVLRRIAKVLAPHPNPIDVEGHTDDQPIRSLIYPSNWELSAARAASVVELFVEYGIAPRRMAAVGYGQYRPIADNDTPEGRAKNRRVTLTVLATRQTTPAEPAQVRTPVDSAPKVSSSLSPIPSPIKLPPRAEAAPHAAKPVTPAVPSSQTSGANAPNSVATNTAAKPTSGSRIAPLPSGRSTTRTLSPIRLPIKLPPLPAVGDAGQ